MIPLLYITNKSRKLLKSKEKYIMLHCFIKLNENNRLVAIKDLENQIGKTVLLMSCL
jgi:hypothetical protein